MSLSRSILILPLAEQVGALKALAKKYISEGRCTNVESFLGWMRPVQHALHAAGAPRERLLQFKKQCKEGYWQARKEFETEFLAAENEQGREVQA